MEEKREGGELKRTVVQKGEDKNWCMGSDCMERENERS